MKTLPATKPDWKPGKGYGEQFWTQLRNAYVIDTGLSYRKLAERYEMDVKSVKLRAGREHWPALRKAHHSRIEHEALATELKEARLNAHTRAKSRTRYLSTARELHKRIRASIQARDEISDDAAAKYANALARAQDVEFRALGINDHIEIGGSIAHEHTHELGEGAQNWVEWLKQVRERRGLDPDKEIPFEAAAAG